MSLDTALQSIVVEPWQRGSTRQSGAAEGPHDAMDEDEHPPTEYDEDGVLRTSLHSLSDLRVIQDMASRTPASGVGVLPQPPRTSVIIDVLGCIHEQRSGSEACLR